MKKFVILTSLVFWSLLIFLLGAVLGDKLKIVFRPSVVKEASNSTEPAKPYQPKMDPRSPEELNLDHFKQTILPMYPSLVEQLKGQEITKATRITLKPEDKNAAYIIEVNEPGVWYFMMGSSLKKVAVTDSCTVKDTKLVYHDRDIPMSTPLKEDRLIVWQSCSGLVGGIALYNYQTSERIPFSDPSGLVSKKLNGWYSALVTPYGPTQGSVEQKVYGKEPVLVYKIDTSTFEVFSVRTGKLVDIVSFDNY